MKIVFWSVILLIFIVIGLVLISWNKPMQDREQAINFVMDDLEDKYPNADYEILSIIKNKTNGREFYNIKARVTFGADTPCPERIHVYYNYPEQGFVVHPPDQVVYNCKYCINQPNCVILFNEEAIIASHTLNGTNKIEDYIDKYNAKPTVSYDKSNEIWKVTWYSDSDETNEYYIVNIFTNNTLKNIVKMNKSF